MIDQKIESTSGLKKIISAVIIFFVYLLVSAFSQSLGDLYGSITLLIVAIILMMMMYHLTKTTKIFTTNIYKGKNRWITLIFLLVFVGLLFLLQIGTNILSVFELPIKQILIVAITALTAGMFEEYLVRLLMMDGFIQWFKDSKYCLLNASLASAIIFGFLHLSNLTFQSPEATFQQIFYAIILGFAFSFIRLRTNSLLTCIIIHTCIDFQPQINSGSQSSSWSSLILVFAPLFIVTFIAIWRLNNTYRQSQK